MTTPVVTDLFLLQIFLFLSIARGVAKTEVSGRTLIDIPTDLIPVMAGIIVAGVIFCQENKIYD